MTISKETNGNTPEAQELSEDFLHQEPKDLSENNQRPSNRRIVRGLRNAGLVTLAVLAAKGGIDFINDSSVNDDLIPDTPALTYQTERAKLETDIERKYGVELLNQREAFERIGRTYDEKNEELVGERPFVRWPEKNLRVIDELLSYVPPKILEHKNEKPFALSMWDFGSEEDFAAGLAFGNETVFYQNAFSGDNLEEEFSLLIHEIAHKRIDKKEFRERLHSVFGNDSELERGIEVVESYGHNNTEPEGVAGLAELYVKGYENFMKSAGPRFDRTEWPQNSATRAEIAQTFKTAHAVYYLYKEAFDGREYDEIHRLLVSQNDSEAVKIGDDEILNEVQAGLLNEIVAAGNFVEIREDEEDVIAPWGNSYPDLVEDVAFTPGENGEKPNWKLYHNLVYDDRMGGSSFRDVKLKQGINHVSIVSNSLNGESRGWPKIPENTRVFVRTLGNTPAAYKILSDYENGDTSLLSIEVNDEVISLAEKNNIQSFDGTELPGLNHYEDYASPQHPLEAFHLVIVIPNEPTPGRIKSDSEIEIESQFGVDLMDLTSYGISEIRYRELKEILGKFPDHLMTSNDVRVKLTFIDGGLDVDLGPLNYLLPAKQLDQDAEERYVVIEDIARILVDNYDKVNGYQPRKTIIEFLGGDEFINNPTEVYSGLNPEGEISGSSDHVRYKIYLENESEGIDEDELISRLTQYYVDGWFEFSKAFSPLFETDFHTFNDLGDKNTKTYELYKLFGELFFAGQEFESEN